MSSAAPVQASQPLQTTAMSPALIVLVLSLLLGLQPVTTDLYLPSLPALTEGFGASLVQAQFTLTALLLAFGLSQLVWGPLSDRYGRRPILLWGLGTFVVASALSALAPNMDWFIGARILQGAAMGAGVMCARAIVRDLFRPMDGVRVMSKGLTGLGMIACLSAPLGGLLADWMGWRVAMLAVSAFGALTWGLVLLCFTESLLSPNPQALRPVSLLRTWAAILRHPTFWAYSALSTTTYCGLFTMLLTSSFVFIKVLGFARSTYGLIMLTVSMAYIIGTLICRRLLPRWGVRRTVAIAGGLTLAGGLLMGGFAFVGLHRGWTIMLPFYLFMLGHGVHQPCSQSGATGPFPYAAGAASALNGFLMMVGAFATGLGLGAVMDGTALPLMYGICFWSVLISLTAWTLVQRHGQSGDH